MYRSSDLNLQLQLKIVKIKYLVLADNTTVSPQFSLGKSTYLIS